MPLIRPVCDDDLPALLELAVLANGQITSLPIDAKALQRKVTASRYAFAADLDRPGGEVYQFVLCNDAGLVVGTATLVSKTGGFEPFYNYRLARERFTSERLGVDKTVRSLHLVEQHDGPAELGGLFLHPSARGGGMGRALSLARLLVMARYPQRFDRRVVAEIRGHLQPDGTSPFWDAIGRHFFEVDFAVADALSLTEKGFVADLMPDHPIYVDMLPTEARAVIGREHTNATPARRMLEGEGFAFRDHIDIFDAGPMLECDLPDIRGVKVTRAAHVDAILDVAGPPDHLVATDAIALLATPSAVRVNDAGVTLPSATARRLDVDVGDTVVFAPLRVEVDQTRAAAEMHDPFDRAKSIDADAVVTTTPKPLRGMP